MFGNRVSAVFIILVIVAVVAIYIAISSWIQETKKQRKEKQGEHYKDIDFRDKFN